jgi:two-component system chemotaxis sensor kinase CheA
MFDIIISDIEMPEMDGFEFASKVRSDARWKDIPLVALTSRTSDSDLARGRKVGFDDHIAKADRGALAETLSKVLAKALAGREPSSHEIPTHDLPMAAE